MAKKKSAKPRASRAKWSDPDDWAMLSWLDFTLKHKELDFSDTVVAHLKQAYSLTQIENRLIRLWNNNGVEEARTTWRESLFTFGSKCIGLTPEDKKEIAKLVQALEEEYVARQLSTPVRRLRSSSRVDSTSRDSLPFRNSPKPLGTAQKLSRTQSLSTTPSRIKREIDCVEVASGEGSQSKKRKNNGFRTYSKKPPLSVGNSFPPPLQHHTYARKTHERQLSSTVDDSEDDLSDIVNNGTDASVPGRRNKPPIKDSQTVNLFPNLMSDTSARLAAHNEPLQTDGETHCLCGGTQEGLELENFIQCDNCNNWQHIRCVKYSFAGGVEPENYFCERCNPEAHKRVSASGTPVLTTGVDSENSKHPWELEVPNQEGFIGRETKKPDAIIFLHSINTDTHFPSSESLIEMSQVTANPIMECASKEIIDLREQLWQKDCDLRDLEMALKELETEASTLREAQRQRDKQYSQPVEQLIEHSLNLKRTLQNDFNKRDDTTRFAILSSESREWFSKRELGDGFYDVYSQSQQIVGQYDREKVEPLPSFENFEELQELLHSCLGRDSAAREERGDTTSRICRMTPQAVVRALATAALRKWVFETDFPTFDVNASELLTHYREVLRTQAPYSTKADYSCLKDGAVALRNLDLAARSSATNSKHFRDRIIPNKAETLAVRFSQVLAPLFTESPENPLERDCHGFATWGEGMEELGERRIRLVRMFSLALDLKAHTCLNIEDYEMVTYEPGTSFDSATMKVETEEGMQDDVNKHEGRVVSLCIEAAVYAHRRRGVWDDSPEAGITSSRNFVHREGKDRIGIQPHVKAVVILTDK